jgi:hypothetical protein
MEDWGHDTAPLDLDAEAEMIFREQYLSHLKDGTPWVRLEREDFGSKPACITLISILQECTSQDNDVLNSSKRQRMRFPAASLLSCSWLCRSIIWSRT